jgi:hypothetical protein
MIMKFVPRPHISYLLDVSPEKARARKPEYPLEFLRTNRQSYMTLRELIGGITLIGSMPLQEVAEAIASHTLNELPLQIPGGVNGDAASVKEDRINSAKPDDALTQ